MNATKRASLTTLLALGAGLAANAAAHAGDEPPDEIVVYGTPTELLLDSASLRVDVKQHARSLGRSVRNALGDKLGETQVAAAEGRTPR